MDKSEIDHMRKMAEIAGASQDDSTGTMALCVVKLCDEVDFLRDVINGNSKLAELTETNNKRIAVLIQKLVDLEVGRD